ncbi:unknown [[Mannheimia] succiniciproducens MBEL55E]|uniref:Uncharacterized protein n=1 Tax=Mannheimia succiniciproducens (strain KCTC 0769BP / MBEL55E) TaxID=221988 RepID=Q65QW5_MANSM|nr:unknown [[Mannheimia] succiniciproducens MBEL55E]
MRLKNRIFLTALLRLFLVKRKHNNPENSVDFSLLNC